MMMVETVNKTIEILYGSDDYTNGKSLEYSLCYNKVNLTYH